MCLLCKALGKRGGKILGDFSWPFLRGNARVGLEAGGAESRTSGRGEAKVEEAPPTTFSRKKLVGKNIGHSPHPVTQMRAMAVGQSNITFTSIPPQELLSKCGQKNVPQGGTYVNRN